MVDPWSYSSKTNTEFANQVSLFMWANMACQFGVEVADDPLSYSKPGYIAKFDWNPEPRLRWLHAIHNQGHGDAVRGARAKAEGVKEGVSDLFLPVPILKSVAWHGLYIELKVGSNKPSTAQANFISDMREVGYDAVCLNGWEACRAKILEYLS